MIQRLKKYYCETIIPKLISLKHFNYKNSYQVPKIQKIVINRGFGDASQNKQIRESSLFKQFKTILIFININKSKTIMFG